MDVVWTFCYLSVLIGLSGYGFTAISSFTCFLKNRKRVPAPLAHFEQLPIVTVQLPLFNEIYVVERLLKSVSELDYPTRASADSGARRFDRRDAGPDRFLRRRDCASAASTSS